MAELRDYREWHDAYDDPGSTLRWRLGVVRGIVADFLDRRPGPVRVVSSCAGDGRDVLGVLAARDDAARVSVVLLEIDEALADRARAHARDTAADVEVRRVDAGRTDAYVGAVPADLLLLVGIFGNISVTDVERTVGAASSLCAPDASVVWTRSRDGEDRTPSIRSWFTRAGFVEQDHVELDRGSRPSVGTARLAAAPAPFVTGRELFTFVR